MRAPKPSTVIDDEGVAMAEKARRRCVVTGNWRSLPARSPGR